MVLLFTDIVGSVDLKKRLGNADAGRLIAEHDRLFREVLDGAAGAEILKDTGDGFLARFETASEAVVVALRFQAKVSRAAVTDQQMRLVRVRIGIHLGEVSELDREETGHAKVSGLAVDLAARVMGMALPGQILLTRAAFDNARQYVREHPSDVERADRPDLKWMAHGPYLFQGHDEPMEVFEVGGVGIAPLAVPPDADKARRAVAADEEDTLGWRPAIGLPIPERKGWVLERRLGEGGFGEVWLGRNERTGSHRVFKFCYDAERLRSFKRELTLFRLLRESLGERDDIARLYEVRLDEAPFYLESEYAEDGSLVEWADAKGGITSIPINLRLDLVARTADAVAAAHSVGVLHKDIKPANILIYYTAENEPRPRLSDFGIGRLTDEARAARHGVTMAGFTSAGDEPSHTGTVIYSPPETLAGKPFTMQGDVFALGVLLYQMVVGDLDRPVAQGWERDIADPLLRQDIAACVEGHEEERLSSAKELADRLRTLPQRLRAARRRRIARLGSVSAVVLLLLLVLASGAIIRETSLRKRAVEARNEAVEYSTFLEDMIASANPGQQTRERAAGTQVTIASVLDQFVSGLEARFIERPLVRARLYHTFGLSYKNLGVQDRALDAMSKSLKIRQDIHAGDHPEVAQSLLGVGDVYYWMRDYTRSHEYHEKSLDMRRRLFDEDSAPVAESMNNLAASLHGLGEYEEADALYRKSLATRMALYEADPDSIPVYDVAGTHNNLARCLSEQAYEQIEAGSPATDPTVVNRFAEADRLFNSAIDLMREAGGDQHLYVARGLHNLARHYARLGRIEDAREKYIEALRMKREVMGRSEWLAETLVVYARFLLDQQETPEARLQAAEALSIRRDVLPSDDLRIAHAHKLVGEIETADGNLDAAIGSFRNELTVQERAAPNDVRGSALVRLRIAGALTELDRIGEAEQELVACYELSRDRDGPDTALTKALLERLIEFYEVTENQTKAAEYRAMLDRST